MANEEIWPLQRLRSILIARSFTVYRTLRLLDELAIHFPLMPTLAEAAFVRWRCIPEGR
jgi:hypothetical protein